MKYLLSLTILLLATQAHADRCKIYKYKIDTVEDPRNEHQKRMAEKPWLKHHYDQIREHNGGELPYYNPLSWLIRWSSDIGYSPKTYNYCFKKMANKLEKHIKDNYEVIWGVECDLILSEENNDERWRADIELYHRKSNRNPKYRYDVYCKLKEAPRVIPTYQDDLGR